MWADADGFSRAALSSGAAVATAIVKAVAGVVGVEIRPTGDGGGNGGVALVVLEMAGVVLSVRDEARWLVALLPTLWARLAPVSALIAFFAFLTVFANAARCCGEAVSFRTASRRVAMS